MEQQTSSKLGKEYVRAVHWHPAYLTYTQSTSWETQGWKKHKLESRLPWEISIICRWHHPYGRKCRTKEPLDESERGEWKICLKLNIQKTKITASGLITSWEIDGETVEIVTDFTFLVSEITADGDCSHEIKRHLLLGRKVMTNLNSTLKGRDITLSAKVCLVKAMVFLVVMYGCES